jgi:hypothetical protein
MLKKMANRLLLKNIEKIKIFKYKYYKKIISIFFKIKKKKNIISSNFTRISLLNIITSQKPDVGFKLFD